MPDPEFSPSVTSAPAPASRYVYLGLSAFMVGIVILGFWPSYYGPLLLTGSVLRPLVIHLHGIVYMGWMALLVTQVALVATGRVRAHRKLGNWGIGYGWLVLAMGLIVTFAAPVLHVQAGEWDIDRAASFIPIPLGDMILFGGFFGAAVAYRRKPDIHKRLMLLATVALLFAAGARMAAVVSTPVALAVWLSPLLIGSAFDFTTRRKVHPLYWSGALIFIVGLLRFPFGQTSLWLPIGRAMVRVFVSVP